jgi:predicted ATP-grasp superfamily ATP-dependent carboligase
MKENKLIEMSNKIDTMGSVLNRIVQELNTMKDLSVGTTELIKLMPGYKKALKELTEIFEEKRKEQEDKKLEV